MNLACRLAWSVPGFGDSSGDPIVIPSDKPTTDTSPVPFIKPGSWPSENPTKNPYSLTEEFKSANPVRMLIK